MHAMEAKKIVRHKRYFNGQLFDCPRLAQAESQARKANPYGDISVPSITMLSWLRLRRRTFFARRQLDGCLGSYAMGPSWWVGHLVSLPPHS